MRTTTELKIIDELEQIIGGCKKSRAQTLPGKMRDFSSAVIKKSRNLRKTMAPGDKSAVSSFTQTWSEQDSLSEITGFENNTPTEYWFLYFHPSKSKKKDAQISQFKEKGREIEGIYLKILIELKRTSLFKDNLLIKKQAMELILRTFFTNYNVKDKKIKSIVAANFKKNSNILMSRI